MSWSHTSRCSRSRGGMTWCGFPHSCTGCSTRGFWASMWGCTSTRCFTSFRTPRRFIPPGTPTWCLPAFRSTWSFVPATCRRCLRFKQNKKHLMLYIQCYSSIVFLTYCMWTECNIVKHTSGWSQVPDFFFAAGASSPPCWSQRRLFFSEKPEIAGLMIQPR